MEDLRYPLLKTVEGHMRVCACMRGGGGIGFVHVKFEVPIRNLTEMQS